MGGGRLLHVGEDAGVEEQVDAGRVGAGVVEEAPGRACAARSEGCSRSSATVRSASPYMRWSTPRASGTAGLPARKRSSTAATLCRPSGMWTPA
ncbi:hypothetical protein ACRAWF_20655 [Streptomyces sp. L7]